MTWQEVEPVPKRPSPDGIHISLEARVELKKTASSAGAFLGRFYGYWLESQ